MPSTLGPNLLSELSAPHSLLLPVALQYINRGRVVSVRPSWLLYLWIPKEFPSFLQTFQFVMSATSVLKYLLKLLLHIFLGCDFSFSSLLCSPYF